MTNKEIGKYGENLAQEFLIKNGYEILEMNFRYSRICEIDIIASKDNILHFVEVKTRTQEFFGSPLEAINKKKLLSIFNCAKFYMLNSNKKYKKYQIDAIGIVVKKGVKPDISFIEDISF